MAKIYKRGTLVTGRIKPLGLYVRSECVDHIWELTSKAHKVSYGTGWVQSARCLVDGYETPEISTEFWQEKASAKTVRNVVTFIGEQIEDLREARKSLKKKLANP